MKATFAFICCCFAGTTLAYYVQRAPPSRSGPSDPYRVPDSINLLSEPSQRLFWGNAGSNQVGGNDWWSTITNKFPFLRNKFGRIQAQNGAPNPTPAYGPPNGFVPQFYSQNAPQFVPSGRDVGFTDDAVIITPPNVPVAPQPSPQPVPQPSPGYQYNKPLNRLELPNH